MASSIIHMAVANEINKRIKRNNDKLLIGSIAPDITKQLGETKEKSHFLDDVKTGIPNIDSFLKKYKDKLNDDFVLGYYIHLYTDYLWYKYFITSYVHNDYITKIDGTVVKCTEGMLILYIYNDYTNLGIQLIDEYNLDLSIFYNEIPVFENIIQEIPMDKIKIIVDKMSIIIENSKMTKNLIFNIDSVKTFIDTSVDLIINELKKLDILV